MTIKNNKNYETTQDHDVENPTTTTTNNLVTDVYNAVLYNDTTTTTTIDSHLNWTSHDLESCPPIVEHSYKNKTKKKNDKNSSSNNNYKPPPALLDLLSPLPNQLAVTSSWDDDGEWFVSPFTVPPTTDDDDGDDKDGNKTIMKIKYLLDVYQLLSLRQLNCVAEYTENDNVQYTYTCANKECSGCFTMTRAGRGELTKEDALETTNQEILEHTCKPHCQWISIGYSSEYKPQGFVMSRGLQFAIVTKFLFCIEKYDDEAFRQLLSESKTVDHHGGVNVNKSECARRKMSKTLGIDVTRQQWKTLLQMVKNVFYGQLILAGKMDRREIDKISCYCLWRFGEGYKYPFEVCWFRAKIRNSDSKLTRRLKILWSWTIFPILVLLQLSFSVIVLILLFPFEMLRRRKNEGRKNKTLNGVYKGKEVKVIGYVSDRWMVRGGGAPKYSVTVTGVLEDGTRMKYKYSGKWAEKIEDSKSNQVNVQLTNSVNQ